MVKESLTWNEEREASRRSLQLRARDGLAESLRSMPWDYYFTVTTRKPWHDAIALSREVYHKLNELTAVERSFIATEPYYLRSGVHAHGLVKTDVKYMSFVPTGTIWCGLFNRFGRSSVDLIRSSADVSMYCSKYVTKSTGDYFFWGRKEFWG